MSEFKTNNITSDDNFWIKVDWARIRRIKWWRKILIWLFGKKTIGVDYDMDEHTTTIITMAKYRGVWYLLKEKTV